MADQPSPSVTATEPSIPAWYRVAAAMIVAKPDVTHLEISRKVGRARETVTRAMHTKPMATAINQACAEQANLLVASAPRALLRAWAKGQGSHQALKILQLRGIFPSDRLELTGADGEPLVPTDVADQIRAYAARLAGGTMGASAAPAQTSPEVADPGTQDGRRTEPDA